MLQERKKKKNMKKKNSF